MPATLPPELLNMIIPACIDAIPTRTNLAERTRLLCTVSLINKTWHAWAEPLIHQHLHLTERHLRRLAYTLEDSSSSSLEPVPERGRLAARKSHETRRSSSSCSSSSSTRSSSSLRSTSTSRTRQLAAIQDYQEPDTPLEQRAHQVNTVALGKWIDEYGTGIKTALKKFDSCDQVYVEGTKSWSALTSVSAIPNIETLHLTRVYNSLPPPDGFPHVKRLSVSFGLSDGIDWSFLSMHKMPKLSTLVLDPYDWAFSQSQSFQTSFQTMSRQLEALALGGSDSGNVDWPRLLHQAESLEHLYIHTSTSSALVKAVPQLACRLASLRIASTSATPEQVADILGASNEDQGDGEHAPASLCQLERLILPIASSNGWDLATDESRKALSQIRQWCQKNDVNLDFVERGVTTLEDWKPASLESHSGDEE
ncbi:hypothetical protein OIV83_003109 [Microbotryomycetes sp. JL201]|nr:hypothetical protein OIV83_003109 [Microbotryomycetes sp. JL201]